MGCGKAHKNGHNLFDKFANHVFDFFRYETNNDHSLKKYKYPYIIVILDILIFGASVYFLNTNVSILVFMYHSICIFRNIFIHYRDHRAFVLKYLVNHTPKDIKGKKTTHQIKLYFDTAPFAFFIVASVVYLIKTRDISSISNIFFITTFFSVLISSSNNLTSDIAKVYGAEPSIG